VLALGFVIEPDRELQTPRCHGQWRRDPRVDAAEGPIELSHAADDVIGVPGNARNCSMLRVPP
jgi:hypothetical protein